MVKSKSSVRGNFFLDAIKVFKTVPDLYLILSPKLFILTTSNAFINATLLAGEEITGKYLFEVFPDNPGSAEVNAVKNLKKSLEEVLASKQPHRLFFQRYDVLKLNNGFEEKHWNIVNTPVVNEMGEVEYIISKFDDITDLIKHRKLLTDIDPNIDLLEGALNSHLISIEILKAVRDEAGKIVDFSWVFCNERAQRYIGQILGGELLLEKNPGTIQDGLFQKCVDVTETGRSIDFEAYSEFEKRKGWFKFSIVKKDDGVVISSIDISRRKQSEEALKKSQNLISRLTEASPDILYVLDLNTLQITYANRNLADELGYKKEQIEKMDSCFFDIMYEPDKSRMLAHIQYMKSLSNNGKVEEVEYRMKDANGQIHWFLARNAVFDRDDKGVPVSKISITYDITEDKIKSQEIEKNLKILNQAEAIAKLGSWDYDIPTEVMQWSDGMYHLFGMEPGVEVFPERYLEFVIPKDRERAEQMIHKIRKEFIPFDETMTITVAGKNKVIQIKAISFDDTGSKPVKMLGVDLDITEKRSNEAKLKQIEEQRQKEVFSAVMQAQEEERRRVAEMLHNEIGQLLTVAKLKIVNNTLEAEDLLNNAIKSVRTISFELMPPILEDFGLEFALKDMIDKKLSEANIDYNSTIKGLKVRLNPEMELTVYRITQEMLNNIIKHSKADLVEIKVVRQPHLIMIQLEDNGIGMKGGIAKDEKQGLGLKLIHNRVHLLKGNLSLSEGKERGTVVLIKIPLSDYN